MNISRLKGLVLVLTILPLLLACNESPDGMPTTGETETQMEETLTVYKHPTCECCTEWMSRLDNAGLDTISRQTEDMNAIKNRYQIAARFQSCHTAVSSRGYVFEGHIPARYIESFLDNPPVDAIGLAVPGMPLGSPGMEVGDRFTPYQVLLLKKDGSSEVFASIQSAAQQ